MINTHDAVRVGAVGGSDLAETFLPGSVSIISNSGNMVNTMASYLLSAGLGTSYGISIAVHVALILILLYIKCIDFTRILKIITEIFSSLQLLL